MSDAAAADVPSPEELLERMDEDPTAGFSLEEYRAVLEEGAGFERVETATHEVYTHPSLPAGTVVVVPKDRHQRQRGHTAVRTVETVALARREESDDEEEAG